MSMSMATGEEEYEQQRLFSSSHNPTVDIFNSDSSDPGMTFEDTQEKEMEDREGSEVSVSTTGKSKLMFRVEERPPLHIALVYGIQVVLSTMGGPMMVVHVIYSRLCAQGDHLLLAEMLSTAIFMMGIATFLQVTIGIRLPMVQGSSPTFLAPVLVMMQMPSWSCPEECQAAPTSQPINMSSYAPTTTQSIADSTSDTSSAICTHEMWRPRLLELSGALVCASVFHCLLGLTGIIGCLRNCIGPLTIAPAVSLVGFSLFPVASDLSHYHWGVTAITVIFYFLYVLVFSKFDVPLPNWNRKRGWHSIAFPIFRIFPMLLTMLTGWLICAVMTVTGHLPDDPNTLTYHARTDTKIGVMDTTKWFFWPYPGYWGMPVVSVSVFVGMVAAVMASILESIGDYFAMAGVCEEPPPPQHAVNRGIAVEGLSSLISGLLGACHATTSYSEVVGMVAMTGMASRFTYQIASVIFVLCGVFGKIGGAMATCPDPVIGAMMIVAMGMVISVALSCLRHCDMTSVRNMMILGVSLFTGLMLPFYLTNNPGVIDTGNTDLDQVVTVFLSTGMIVGGLLGFLLDNIFPGTREERGLSKYHAVSGEDPENDLQMMTSVYDFPLISNWLRQHVCCKYIPVMPSYTPIISCCCNRCHRDNANNSLQSDEVIDASHGHVTDNSTKL